MEVNLFVEEVLTDEEKERLNRLRNQIFQSVSLSEMILYENAVTEMMNNVIIRAEKYLNETEVYVANDKISP